MAKKSLQRQDQPDWVVVAYAHSLIEAEIIAGLLKSFEVPVFIQRESVGQALGLTIGALGMIRLLVPAQFEIVAMKLLDDEDDEDLSTLIDGPSIIFPEDVPHDEDD